MTKKLITLSMAIITLACICGLMFAGCNKEIEPRDVVLELINPHTGEVLKGGERIDVPAERTYVEVKIKDKETGEYLTDDDLPDNTITDSYYVGFEIIRKDGERYGPIDISGIYWPKASELHAVYDHYEVAIHFDCKPKYLKDPEYQRKYKRAVAYVRIYINRPDQWQEV